MPSGPRPLGVTLIGVVATLVGLFGLLGGFSAMSGAAPEPVVLGLTVVIFGVLGLVLGYGFLTGRGWARVVGLALYALSLPLGVAEIALGGAGAVGGAVRVVVGLLIMYYLTRPHVKGYFGRA